MDTELNLVTECWVEPQSGTVMNCMDQHRYFQGLKYQEIPQAVCITNTYSSSTHSFIMKESAGWDLEPTQFTGYLYIRLFVFKKHQVVFNSDLLCCYRSSQGIWPVCPP